MDEQGETEAHREAHGTVYNTYIGHGSVIAIGDDAQVIQAAGSVGRVAESSAAPTSDPRLAVIRELLNAAFSDDELMTLCFDHFRAVYEEFTTGMRRSQKVQLLLEHAERYGQLEALLEAVHTANPHQYARFAARLNAPTAGSETEP